MDRPSQHLAAPITLPPDLEQEDELVDWQELWTFVALPPSRAAAGFEPAAFGEPRSTGSIASAASPEAALEPAKPITTQPAKHGEPATGGCDRDDIASGLKAGASNSLHGGKARTGGYGQGQAVDVTSADGNASEVWRWIDVHGGKYGLYRPMQDDDPAHVQPRGSWHKLAASLRESRARMSQQARADAQ